MARKVRGLPGWLSLASVFLATTAVAQQPAEYSTQDEAPAVSLALLGTAGGPPPHVGRAQPSTVLRVGDREYLIDAGEGAAFQLQQVGIMPNMVDAIFLTHLHWDHVLGLDYLMATGWMRNRTVPAPIYGPQGLDFFLSRQLAAIEVGEAIFRSQADARPPLYSLYPANQIDDCSAHEVYADDHVTVTAVCNTHFAEVRSEGNPYGEDAALSYRFDTASGSVTFTGDSGPSEELTALATGSDVLVAEIVDLPSIERALQYANPGGDNSVLMSHMAHQHLTPEEVGRMATRAGVETVVLHHFIIGPGFAPDQFADQVRAHFDGHVIVGQDLMVVPITSAD